MNKPELVEKLAEKAQITKKDATAALDAFMAVVTEELVKGEKITLTGFGSFETAIRAAREGRNPATGDTVHIPETRVPKFKPGKQLKGMVK